MTSDDPYDWVVEVMTTEQPKDSGRFEVSEVRVELSCVSCGYVAAKMDGDVAEVTKVGPDGIQSRTGMQAVREAEEAMERLPFVSEVRTLTALREMDNKADDD